MFPIRDHNPSEKTPFVNYALIAINVVVFLAYWPLFADEFALNRFFYEWALIPARVASGDGFQTLVTSMFLHGGLLHLAGNMLFLWIFGDNLEEDFGHLGFLAFYLAGGVGAALVHFFAAPWSQVPTVGASGAIAGVMGGYLLMYPKAKVDILFIFIVFFKVIPVPAWLMLGIWFTLQLFNGVGSDLSAGGVAYWAHAGGFLVGFALTVPLFVRRGGFAFWTRTHGHPDHPDAKYQFGAVVDTDREETQVTTFRATCHCGAVELKVTLAEGGLATARRCDCSFCRRRGAAAVSAPLDGVKVVRGADKLTLYEWGTHTAKHYFCSTCGIYTHHRRRSNPNEYGVNLGALEGVNPRDLGDIRWTDGVNHPSDQAL